MAEFAMGSGTFSPASQPAPTVPSDTIPDTLLPLAEIYSRLETPPEEQPAVAEAAKAITSLLRNYCGRLFNYVAGTATFQAVSTARLWVPNPPLVSFTNVDGWPNEFVANMPLGYLEQKTAWRNGISPPSIVADLITMDISAGFEVIPADLSAAFLASVSAKAKRTEMATDGGLNVVKSISTPDVGNMSFVVGDASALFELERMGVPYDLLSYRAVYDFYRVGHRWGM